MVEVGVLADDERLELLDGDLVYAEALRPIQASLAVTLRDMLQRAYGDVVHVRSHSPIDGGRHSLPVPDVAVVRGDPRDFGDRHPAAADIILVVEIACSSHAVDRRKGRIYASAGVPECWLIDVPSRRLERRTRPSSAGDYSRIDLVEADGSVALPELDSSCSVASLLPREA